jgi:hypothetical protein
VVSTTTEAPSSSPNPPRGDTVSEGKLVPVALLIAAGGPQTSDQLVARAQALLGVDLSNNDLCLALEALSRQGLIEIEGEFPGGRPALDRFLEQRGMHPYLRELVDMLATEENSP